MMRVDLVPLAAAVRGRLITDSAGAAVRALLGSDAATRFIDVEDLTRDALPARPFLAFRRGPAPVDGGLVIATFTWHLYDDPRFRYGRIDALLRPIAIAYDPDTPADVMIWGGIALQIGDPRPDPTLSLLHRPVQLAIYAV
jgi:hypothetical protein